MRHALVNQLAKELRSSRRQEQFSPDGNTSRPPRAPKFFLPLLPSPPRRGRQRVLRATPLRQPGSQHTVTHYAHRTATTHHLTTPTRTCRPNWIQRPTATESRPAPAQECLLTPIRRPAKSGRPRRPSCQASRRPRSRPTRRLTTSAPDLPPAPNPRHPATPLVDRRAGNPGHPRLSPAVQARTQILPPFFLTCARCFRRSDRHVSTSGLAPARPCASSRGTETRRARRRPSSAFPAPPAGFSNGHTPAEKPAGFPQQSAHPTWERPVPLSWREAHQRPETTL